MASAAAAPDLLRLAQAAASGAPSGSNTTSSGLNSPPAGLSPLEEFERLRGALPAADIGSCAAALSGENGFFPVFVALQLLEYVVRYRWDEVGSVGGERDTVFLSTCVGLWSQLAVGPVAGDTEGKDREWHVLCGKLTGLVAELAVRLWPQEFPELDALLLLGPLREHQQGFLSQGEGSLLMSPVEAERRAAVEAALLEAARATVASDPVAALLAVQSVAALAEVVHGGMTVAALPVRRRRELTTALRDAGSGIAAVLAAALEVPPAIGEDPAGRVRFALLREAWRATGALMPIFEFRDIVSFQFALRAADVLRFGLELYETERGEEVVLGACDALQAISARRVSDSDRRALVAMMFSNPLMGILTSAVSTYADEAELDSPIHHSFATLLGANVNALATIMLANAENEGSLRLIVEQLVGTPDAAPRPVTKASVDDTGGIPSPEVASVLGATVDLLSFWCFRHPSSPVNQICIGAFQRLLSSHQLYEFELITERLPQLLDGAHGKMRKIFMFWESDAASLGVEDSIVDRLQQDFESLESCRQFFAEFRTLLKRFIRVLGVADPTMTLAFASQMLQYRLQQTFGSGAALEPDDVEHTRLEAVVCFLDAAVAALHHKARYRAGHELTNAQEGGDTPFDPNLVLISTHAHPFAHLSIPPHAIEEALLQNASESPGLAEVAQQIIEDLVAAPIDLTDSSPTDAALSDSQRASCTIHVLSALQSASLFLAFSPQHTEPLLSRCLTLATFVTTSGDDDSMPPFVLSARRKACSVISGIASSHPRLVAPLFPQLWEQVQSLSQQGLLLEGEHALLAEALASSSTALADEQVRDEVLGHLMGSAMAEWEAVMGVGVREADVAGFLAVIFPVLEPTCEDFAVASAPLRRLRSATMTAAHVWQSVVDTIAKGVDVGLPQSVADFLPIFASLTRYVGMTFRSDSDTHTEQL
jgi:Exportin-5 family